MICSKIPRRREALIDALNHRLHEVEKRRVATDQSAEGDGDRDRSQSVETLVAAARIKAVAEFFARVSQYLGSTQKASKLLAKTRLKTISNSTA